MVAAYLDALRRSDAASMAALVGPGTDARSAIADASADDGGLALDEVTATYLDEFGGSFVIATVTGTSGGATRTIEIPIARVGERYSVALGEATPSGPIGNPNSPAPAS